MTPSPSWPTIWGGEEGAGGLGIEWDDGPHAKLTTKDIVDELEQATLNPGAVAQTIGEPQRDGESRHEVEAIYQVPFLAHATMEPMNCTAHVRLMAAKSGWAPRPWRGPRQRRRNRRTALDKVVVHNHLIGGGFGRRLDVDGIIRAVQIAQHVDGQSRSCGRVRKISSTTCIGRTGSTDCPLV